jgi:hypothetical protein
MKMSRTNLRSEPSSGRKKWSKWLKFAGSALLLLAFGLQMRQNQQSALGLERTEAAELDSRAHMKALEYENLYLSSRDNEANRGIFLKYAAQEYYLGRSSMMSTSPGDKDQIGAKLREIKKAADGVGDVPSFNRFMQLDQATWGEWHDTEFSGLIEPDHAAKSLGAFYLSLYVLGSVLALMGQGLD